MTDLGSRPSLRLGFDVTRTRVELRTLPGLQDDFAQLAARIATSGQRGPVSAEVDLDDFLVNLSELASWVHPGVDWDADLMALVNGVLDDSDTVQRNLEASPGEPTGGSNP